MKRLAFYIIYYLLNVAVAIDSDSILLTAPMMLVILAGVTMTRGQNFGAVDMFWLICFLMFVIGPLQAYSNLTFVQPPVGGVVFEWRHFTIATTLITLFLSAVVIGLAMKRRFRLFRVTRPLNNNNITIHVGTAFSVFFLSCLLYVVMSGGLENVISPRRFKSAQNSVQGAIVFYAFAVVTFFYLLHGFSNKTIVANRVSQLIMTFAFLCMLVICNPFNTPRFFLIGTWLPAIFIILRGRFPVFRAYLAALFSLVIIMPILSVTTRQGYHQGAFSVSLESIVAGITDLRYIDLYDMTVYMVRYIDFAGHRLGESFLGMLLFFVPRSLWSGKPELAGIILGDELFSAGYAGTFNLSLFYGAEFYLDFGYAGVIFAGLLTGYILRGLSNFSSNANFDEKILVYIFIGSLPIVIRGPLAAVIPLLAFQVVAFFVLKTMLRKKIVL